MKQNLQNDVKEAYKYLINIESVIDKELYRHNNVRATQDENGYLDYKQALKFHQNNFRPNKAKWCSLHKNNSHDTKKRFYNKSIKDNSKYFKNRTNEHKSDDLKIVTEPVRDFNTILLKVKINKKNSRFLLDSSASKNFICKRMVDELQSEVEEDKPVEDDLQTMKMKRANTQYVSILRLMIYWTLK